MRELLGRPGGHVVKPFSLHAVVAIIILMVIRYVQGILFEAALVIGMDPKHSHAQVLLFYLQTILSNTLCHQQLASYLQKYMPYLKLLNIYTLAIHH